MFDKKILIVEDEEDIREPFRDYLSLVGFKNVLTAANASEALAKIGQEKPDLILLDIQLKEEIDGVAILRRTKGGLSASSKVVMVSGHKDEYEAGCYKLGADGFWKKPIMPNQIVEKIGRIFSGKSPGS